MTSVETKIMQLEEKLRIITIHRYTPEQLRMMPEHELSRVHKALEEYRREDRDKGINNKDFKTFSCIKPKN